MPTEDQAELVTFREIARRVRQEGLAPTMSHQRVSQLARTDPAWPIPREKWLRAGPAWVVPWAPVRAYFAARAPIVAARDRRRRTSSDRDENRARGKSAHFSVGDSDHHRRHRNGLIVVSTWELKEVILVSC